MCVKNLVSPEHTQLLDHLLHSELAEDYLQWCATHSVDPKVENALVYAEMIDEAALNNQEIPDDIDGIQ